MCFRLHATPSRVNAAGDEILFFHVISVPLSGSMLVGGGMGGVDGGSGLLRSRSRSRGSFRPGQRQPDSTLREAQLQAAARRLLAGGLTGQLLRLAAAELGSSAREKAEEITAILEAGSQRAAMD